MGVFFTDAVRLLQTPFLSNSYAPDAVVDDNSKPCPVLDRGTAWAVGPEELRSVDLTGFDLLTGHVYVSICYFFVEDLSVAVLRAALAETLQDFPMLSGRLRRKDRRVWVDCTGEGAVLRSQEARVEGGRLDGKLEPDALRPHMPALCGSEVFARPNSPSPLLIVTCTRIMTSPGSGPAALASRRFGARPAPLRSALCLSIPHSLVDGAAFTAFVATFAARTSDRAPPLPPPAHDRRPLVGDPAVTSTAAEEGASTKYAVLGRLELTSLYARLLLMQGGLETVAVRFGGSELAAIKAEAMGRIAGGWVVGGWLICCEVTRRGLSRRSVWETCMCVSACVHICV
jgi:hypothetical protein